MKKPKVVTREELERLLEERVESRLGISVEEFIQKADRDELPDSPSSTGLGLLLGTKEH